MTNSKLAVNGGDPVYEGNWPQWPLGDKSTEESLLKALYSGRWAISGPYLGEESFERKFSQAFSEFNKSEFCTPVSNGSSSLLSALIALGVGRGDEVIVPGLTWVACATTVLALGAKPVIVDVDLNNLCISPEKVKAAITEKTKAIMLVHAFGAVADLDAFKQMSQEEGIPLIEDCSQAHGAMWGDSFVGTIGAFGCFSMQQSKLLTSGEGGAVITNDPELYLRVEQARSDGRVFSSERMSGAIELKEVGEVQGHNMCLSEFQSAVLLEQLKKLESENKTREKNAKRLIKLLESVDGVESIEYFREGTSPVFYNFVLRFDLSMFESKSIDAISLALSQELNLFIRPIYRPMNEHPLYKPEKSFRHGLKERDEIMRGVDIPNAKLARETCLAFHHSALLTEDVDAMEKMVTAISKIKEFAVDIPDVENLAAI